MERHFRLSLALSLFKYHETKLNHNKLKKKKSWTVKHLKRLGYLKHIADRNW